jgi:hypothetical protein
MPRFFISALLSTTILPRPTNTLFVAAGPDDETHGLFDSLVWAPWLLFLAGLAGFAFGLILGVVIAPFGILTQGQAPPDAAWLIARAKGDALELASCDRA